MKTPASLAVMGFGALGLLFSGPWAFGGPMGPWLAVFLAGLLSPAVLAAVEALRAAGAERLDDARAARRALDEAEKRLDARAAALEERVRGLFTPEQAVQLARDQDAMVLRMAEIENKLAEFSTIVDVKRMTGTLHTTEHE